MLQWTILVCAAFLAGVMNTLAGGGTFLTFPALTYCGVPPIAANATSALVVFPGYLTGAMGFRSELRSLDRRDLFKKSAIAAVGGLVGALLLLVSSKEVFAAVIPVLLSLATVTFALGDRLQAWARNVTAQSKSGLIGTLAVSIYGGYFNGGLGIMLLALFSLWGKAAVSAAITSAWSNGQTEGQITKLKLVKRQMYGRAKLDLLEARLIGAT